MKTLKINKSSFILFALLASFFLGSFSFQAQEVVVKGTVKGIMSSKTELLDNASIYLKGTNIATTSNKKGEFTFPKKLKVGDVLVFSYLGYLKKSIKIKQDSSNLNVVLKEDDNQMLGALNTNKRFSSKRKKQ